MRKSKKLSLRPASRFQLLDSSARRGYSLIEILIVLVIMILISLVVFTNLQAGHGIEDLNNTAKQMAALLRQAQSQAAEGQGHGAWGVYFSNAQGSPGISSFYALISSSTYSTGTTVGYYVLPPTIAYLTSTLSGGASLTISFSSLSGTASASTSIGLYIISKPSLSSTIMVASTGAVSY